MLQPEIILSEPHIDLPPHFSNSTTEKRLRLGEILQAADLVSNTQIEIALRDQQERQDLNLGEILALRGWIQQETADFFAEQWYEIIEDPEKQPIGQYLKQAGLLKEDQIEAILVEQRRSWLKFGAIAVLQGWLKQTTVNFFIESLFPEHKSNSPYVSYQDNQGAKQSDSPLMSETELLDQLLAEYQESGDKLDS